MRISSRAKYGLLALVEIADAANQNRRITAPMIAKRNHISLKFLSQILQFLSLDGIVSSKRGNEGGYYLTKPPSKILLTDIVAILDHNISYDNHQNEETKPCELWAVLNECVWSNLDSSIAQITDGISLEDIMNQCCQKRMQ